MKYGMRIEAFIKNATKEELLEKLTELKLTPQTEDVKLFIQKILEKNKGEGSFTRISISL